MEMWKLDNVFLKNWIHLNGFNKMEMWKLDNAFLKNWIHLNGFKKMEMWKLDNAFLKNWQFSSHSFNCRKVGRVQLSYNFFILLSLLSHSVAISEYVKR